MYKMEKQKGLEHSDSPKIAINEEYFFHSKNWIQMKKKLMMNKLRDGLKT